MVEYFIEILLILYVIEWMFCVYRNWMLEEFILCKNWIVLFSMNGWFYEY